MNVRSATALAAGVLSVVLMTPTAVRAGTSYDFTYLSTTNSAYNNRVHLRNTGIYIQQGQAVHIAGSGQLSFGGGYVVMSNFAMGLISTLNGPEAIRDLQSSGTPLHFQPKPAIGESVLFTQDRASLTDNHHLSGTFTALTDGWVHVGVTDNYYADNTGHLMFHITLVPEPAVMGLALVLIVAVRRRRVSLS